MLSGCVFPKGFFLSRHKEFHSHSGLSGGEEPASKSRPDTLPSFSFIADTCQSSVTRTDPALCMEGRCGHMSTYVRPVDRECPHTCVESYVAGSGRDWKPGRPAVARALFSASPSPVHCLFTCVVLESEVKWRSHRDSHPQSCSERQPCGGGCISGSCV